MGGKGREIKRRGERGEKFTLPLERRWQRFAHYNLQSALPLDRGRQIFTNYNDENKNCNNITTTSKRTTAVITQTTIVGYY